MKTIKVAKITPESYNKLVSLGYKVEFVQSVPTPKLFAKYVYEKPIRIKRELLKVQPRSQPTQIISKPIVSKSIFEKVWDFILKLFRN